MGVGLIRIMLAFSVVLTHTGTVFGFNIVNGVMAVRTFYIISGFYMAMILDGKYNSYSAFIKSRFLRIFPIYYVVLFLTVLAGASAHFIKSGWGELGGFVHYGNTLNPLSLISILIVNLMIIGRNLVMFLGVNAVDGSFIFLKNFDYKISASIFLLIPQAWTITVELLFYLIAPFIVRLKNYALILFFLAGLGLRSYMATTGFTQIYWTDRFFPIELVFFLMGIMGYRIYHRLPQKSQNLKKIASFISAVIIILFFLYNYLPVQTTDYLKSWWFYSVFALALPFVFLASKSSQIDRKLGDLSYPIYISHILIIVTIYPSIFNHFIGNRNYLGIVAFLIAAVFSILLIKIIQDPVDRYRHKKMVSSA